MNLMQHLLERLRPIVNFRSWDYCVLWNLGDDQRFLEWMDCCCAGSENIQNGGEELLFPSSSVPPCRDLMFQHPRTKPCDLLAELPSSIPLDSGIYAQTLMSNQARWLNFSNNSDSNALEETVGTRVLIPVPIGLVELFVAKQVPEDQQIIDYITAQCSNILEQQVKVHSNNMDPNFSVNVNEIQSNPFLSDKNSEKDHNNPFHPATSLENSNLPYDISVDRIQLCNSPMNFLQPFKNDSFFDGSNDSFLADKPINLFNSSGENGFQEMEGLQSKDQQQGTDKDSIKHETGRSESISDCSDLNEDEDDAKYRRRTGKGPQSKNLVAERKRRKKLSERLYTLRSLVPIITKLDRASILGDAINFVKELQKQVKDLQHELEDQSDDEGTNNNNNYGRSEILNQNGINNVVGLKPDQLENAPSNGFHMGGAAAAASNGDVGGVAEPPKPKHESDSCDKQRQMEPQVEVAQLDVNEFFIKVFCEHKNGGFVRLIEALNSLGLEVTNVNVASFRTLVSNVFKVEKRDSEMVQVDYVRNSLLKITRNPSEMWPDQNINGNGNGNDNDNGMDYHHHHDHRRHTHHHLHSNQISSHHHHHHHKHLHNQP
ncbi:hypothetical protein ACSBR1_003633 [Camellia fascicularis]